MAVVGICKASVLDSCVGENKCPVARRCGGNNERSTSRTSSIRKMWKDLEREGKTRDDGRQQMSGLLTGHDSRCSSSLEGESIASEDISRDACENENECPQNQNRSQNQMAFQNKKEDNENLCLHHTPSLGVPEKERVRKLFHEWGSKSFEGHTLYSPRMSSSRSQWPAENECKRVRIVREWIESSTQLVDTWRTGSEEPVSENGSPMGLVRDGIVDVGNCARSSIRRIYGRQALLDLLAKFVRERKREVDNLLENRYVSNFGHRHRIQSLLKGRFLRNQRFVEAKKQTSVPASELGLLRQKQAVSEIRKGFLSRLNNYHQAAECAQSDMSSDNEMNYDHIKQADKTVENIETTNLTSNSESHNSQEYASLETLHHEERPILPLAVNHAQTSSATSSDNRTKYEHIKQAKEIVDEIPDEICEELESNSLTIRWESSNPQIFAFTVDERCDHDESLERNQSIANYDLSQGTLGTECATNAPLAEVYGSNVEEQETHELSVIEDDDDDDYAWHHINRIESHEGIDAHLDEHENGWYQETLRGDFQESQEWYENGNALEGSAKILFGRASYLEAALADRSNALYTSGDDNGRRVELTELSSRRRVSNLLESDFGTRLDQLMQSYVERQDQAFELENGWIQDQEQHSLDYSGSDIEAVHTTEAVANTQISDFHEHLGIEWEIINGLRLDMNTLQQRMDGMQKMLETCMNMQRELQRSVYQEVHSALLRSLNSKGACEDGIRNDQSEARSGMEGVCFLCCDNGPNRSAHMYICSKCAEKINWSKLKESVRHP